MYLAIPLATYGNMDVCWSDKPSRLVGVTPLQKEIKFDARIIHKNDVESFF